MSLLINTITIAVVVIIVPGINIVNFRFITLVLLAIGLGVLNTFLKPILQVLTIRLLFITYGLMLIVVNTGILIALGFISNSFQIESLLAALIGSIIIGLLGSFLEYSLGVTPPLAYHMMDREGEL